MSFLRTLASNFSFTRMASIAPKTLGFNSSFQVMNQFSLMSSPFVREFATKTKPARIKFKPNASVKKRFRLTGSGQLKRTRTGKGHKNDKKGRQRVRDLGGTIIVKGPDRKRILKMMGC